MSSQSLSSGNIRALGSFVRDPNEYKSCVISGESVALSGLGVFISQVHPDSSPQALVLQGSGIQDTDPLPLQGLIPGIVLLWDDVGKLRPCRPEAPAPCTTPRGPGAGTLCLEHTIIEEPLRSVA